MKKYFILIFLTLNLSCTAAFRSQESLESESVVSMLPIVTSDFTDGTTNSTDTTSGIKLKTYTDTETQIPLTGRFAKDLVSLWRFNDEGNITDGASIFTDEQGGHTGQAVTPGNTMIFSSGVFNESVLLNGTTDYIQVTDHSDYQITDALSISVWLKPTVNQEGLIIQRGEASNGGGYQLNVDIGTSGPIVKFRINTGATTFEDVFSQELIMNEWNHIVGVYVPGFKMQMFLNGKISSELNGSVPTSIFAPPPQDLYIGYSTEFSEYYAGHIDELAIWNRILSPGEVEELYNRGAINYGNAPNGIRELPNYNVSTEAIDMSDNALLMHFDDYKLLNSTSVTDYSGNNNHGTLAYTPENNEVSWISNLMLGLKFDGVNDYVSISPSSSLNSLNDFTVSFWIRPSFKGSAQYIFSINQDNRSIYIMPSGDELFLGVSVGCTLNTAAAMTIPGSVKIDQWQHVVVKYSDSTNKTVDIFINGIKQDLALSVMGSGSTEAPTGDIEIGRRSDGSLFFNGLLDEFSIWNRVLTEQEIKNIYNLQSLLSPNFYTSKIYDSLSTSTVWQYISWTPKAPYQKTLPEEPEMQYNSNNASSSLLNGIIMHYRLDEINSTTFIDESTNEFNATCTVCPRVLEDSLFGNSQEFSPAVGQAISISNNATIQNLKDGMSFSVWFYPRSRGGTLASNTDVHGRFFDLDGAVSGDGYYFTLTQSAVKFMVDTDSTDFELETIQGLIKFNTWNHAVLTWDGGLDATSSAKIYINGQETLYRVATDGTGTFDSSANDLYLGAGISGDVHTFDGYLDEAIFWNRVLLPEEVSSLYLRGATNIQIQKRVCDLEDCSDQNFTGPNNQTIYFYSETLNSSINLPSLLPVTTDNQGRYFQYRVFLNSLDPSVSPELIGIKIQ